MNKQIRTLLTMAAFGAASSALLAQPAVKLVVVDLGKAYDAYYKAEESTAKMKEAEQKAQEQVEELNKQGQAAVDEYKELIEQSKNAMLTPEARAKADGESQKKAQDIQRKQNEVQTFISNTQRSLQQRMKVQRDLLFEEINKVIADLAKRKGATLVLDKAGPTLFGVPGVLYSDASYEITDEVIKEENKDRPAPVVAAPALTAPGAKPAAPATFSVPNVVPEPKKP